MLMTTSSQAAHAMTAPSMTCVADAAVLYIGQSRLDMCAHTDLGQYDSLASNQNSTHTYIWQEALMMVKSGRDRVTCQNSGRP